MSEEENSCDETESSSTDSSDDESELAESIGKDFFKTLSLLKSKDPKIYDNKVSFFNNEQEETETHKKKKDNYMPMFLRDFHRKLLTEKGGKYSDEEDEHFKTQKPYVEVQNDLKDNLKMALLESEDDEEDDGFGGLLKKRTKSEKEKEIEEADYIQWLKGQKEEVKDDEVEDLKPLHDYWNDPNLDKSEGFLRDFILNKKFIMKDEKDDTDNDDESELSEDGRTLEVQEEFEQNYNLRFELGEDFIKRYPREMEGSLRRKDDKRTKKRAEIRARKVIEKEKKREGIKQIQNQKRREIEERLEELKKMIGNDDLGFSKEDILEDFDSQKYDKKMEEIFNDDFYAEEQVDKPEFNDEDMGEDCNKEDGEYDSGPNCEDPDFNMDCEAHLQPTRKNKKRETRTKRKKKQKKNAFSDIAEIEKPVYDPAIHESFQKYLDEYYSLDCEDFIDDLPCRFRYRSVVPNDYGLSVEEILMADDKELNKWCPWKKLLMKKPDYVEKNEVKIYKKKGMDENLKRKILSSLYQSEETEEGKDENDTENTTIVNDNEVDQGKEQPSNSSRKKSLKGNTDGQDQKIKKVAKGISKPKHKGHSYAGKLKKSFKTKSELTDNRLKAYGIKPKKFRKFVKNKGN